MRRSAFALVLAFGLLACADKPPTEAPPPPAATDSAVAPTPPPPKVAEVSPTKQPPPPMVPQPVPEPKLSFADAKPAEAPSQAAAIDLPLWDWFLSSVIQTADSTPFRIPEASKLRTPAARVGLVKGLFPAVRALAATSWFAARYENTRRQMLQEKPREKFKARGAAEIDRTMQAQMEAQIAALEQVKKTAGLGPTQQADLQKAIDEMKRMLANAKSNPSGAQVAAAEADAEKIAEAEEAAAAETRQAERAAIERRFPADPKQLVAMRIGEVLELTKDVDFAAKTKKNPIGQQRFVKDEYEAKPRVWKAAYRAGKPTYDACRTFAQDWQRDLLAGKW